MGQPPDPQPGPQRRARRPLLRNEIISQALLDPEERAAIGLPDSQDQDLPVVIELNLQYRDGLDAVTARFEAKWAAVIGTPVPERTADLYYSAGLTIEQLRALVEDDLRAQDPAARVVYRVWPDFPVQPRLTSLLDRIKAEGARTYRYFGTPAELARLVRDDLAMLLSEHFAGRAPRRPARDRKSTRLNSSHVVTSRMPSSA